MIQYLLPDGSLTPEGQKLFQTWTNELKLEIYIQLWLVRLFDQRCINLQRQGRIGTYAPLGGQEAAQVGSVVHLQSSDWIFPSYREMGVQVVYGLPLKQILWYWMGRIEGNRVETRILPPCVPVATQLPHAVGAAWALKKNREQAVSVSYFGDGATSEGDFHEACNFAGVFRVPVIFFCQNNQYAISVPFYKQSASPTVVEKANAYGFPGIQVDGNDVIAVYHVMQEAIQRAKETKTPTLIEALTYRKGAHTTADDPIRYRPAKEAEEWSTKRDPIERYEKLLYSQKVINDKRKKQIIDSCKEKIEKAVHDAEKSFELRPQALFEHVYQSESKHLENQMNSLFSEEG